MSAVFAPMPLTLSFDFRLKALRRCSAAALGLTLLGSSFISNAAIQFSDATAGADLGYVGESYGASWGDLNGDGYPDLFANNHRKPVSLYLNMGNGKFVDVARRVHIWAFRATADTHGGTWADFDNDGDQDLFVSLGRNPNGTVQQFLVNRGGDLVNLTTEYGIESTDWGGRTPIWFDGNFDGRMDFMMAMYGHAGEIEQQGASGLFTNVTKTNKFNCFKYHYGQLIDLTGDGRMELLCSGEGTYPSAAYNTRTTPYTNVTNRLPAVDKVADAIMADLDNDLRKDIFQLRGTSRPSSVTQHDSQTIDALLQGGIKGFEFVTSGKVKFVLDWNRSDEGKGNPPIKIGSKELAPANGSLFTLDPTDPDVVGEPTSDVAEYPMIHVWYEPAIKKWHLQHLNGQVTGATGAGFSSGYFVVTSESTITNLKSTGLWATERPMKSTALMNTAGGWQDQAAALGLGAAIQCNSGVAGDFDNDMDQDIYLACRDGATNLPNILFENKGAAGFVMVSNAGGAEGPVGAAVSSGAGTADSVVTADYDVDGFLDLFVTNGFNMRPVGAGGPDKLFRNQGNGNHWIEIDLVGTGTSTRDAVGARVIATANGVSQLREQDFGFHRWSQNFKRLHFGLASATKVELAVTWPNGATDTFANVSADRVIRIKQGTGISDVALGDGVPYPCGVPTYSAGSEKALVIWKDCVAEDAWRIRFLAGGSVSNVTYTGTLFSSLGITGLTKVAAETTDTATLNGKTLSFAMTTNGSNQDGINFNVPYGGSTCFNVNLPAGAQVQFGRFREPLTPPFDIHTLKPCTP